MKGNPNVKFKDGTPLQKKDSAKYLGAIISKYATREEEIKSRIKDTMKTLEKLHTFFELTAMRHGKYKF